MYSHLNGHEHILVHKPQLLQELMDIIQRVDATQLRTKLSKEKRSQGQYLTVLLNSTKLLDRPLNNAPGKSYELHTGSLLISVLSERRCIYHSRNSLQK